MMKQLMLFVIALPIAGCSESVVFKVNVHDEEGTPVANAVANINTLKKLFVGAGNSLNDYRQIKALSDTNGVVAVKFDLASTDFRYWLTADGYYGCPTRNVHYKLKKDYLYHVTFAEHEKEDSVVMRKIRNPIPMFGHGPLTWAEGKLPDANGEYGFDMEAGSLVSPFGKGRVADFYIRKNFTEVPRSTKSALFFRGKGNGAYKMKSFLDSEFRSCYTADTNATLSTEFRHEFSMNAETGHREVCDVERDECLILRTRCRYDEKGNLVSCNYSKIYGRIEISDQFCLRSYAFNPTPNDPNLEFDVKRNLLKKDTAPCLP